MKIFTFIAACIVCILLFSCSNDDLNTTTKPTFNVQKELDSLYFKESDTLNGEPVPPPKGKDD